MGQYELLYILPAKYTEAELKEMSDKIGGIITNLGATITETHQLGTRKLAYAIQNVRNGSYVLVHFDAVPTTVPKMNDVLRLSTDLLRHMIVVRDPHATTIPSIIEEERPSMRRDGGSGNSPSAAPTTSGNLMAQAAVVSFGSDKVDGSAA
jgi:small subunit ribosomal protein S6